ncbi:MAG: SRPBCC family protein [Caulobacteraceae bacterium]
MTHDRFFYVTYIRARQEKVWRALIEPEFTRQYWNETYQESDWKVGADWKLMIPDGRVGDSGKVLEFDPPRRLSLSWQNQFVPDLKEEGHSRCTVELVTQGEVVRLTVTHEIDIEGSKLIAGVSQGWPMILASLKSLLETGAPFEASRRWPEGH